MTTTTTTTLEILRTGPLALVEDLGREGVTVVMSTHNLGQAKRLADRVLYLEGGHLRVDLPAARFFDDREPHAATAFLKGELPWT